MNLTRKTYTTRGEKIIDFVIGFGGILLVNVIFFFLSFVVSAVVSQNSNLSLLVVCLSFLPWVINLGAIIFFAFTRHWIALGALAVPVVGFLISLCLGVILFIMCFGGAALSSFTR